MPKKTSIKKNLDTAFQELFDTVIISRKASKMLEMDATYLRSIRMRHKKGELTEDMKRILLKKGGYTCIQEELWA